MSANFFAKIKPLFGGKLTQGQVEQKVEPAQTIENEEVKNG